MAVITLIFWVDSIGYAQMPEFGWYNSNSTTNLAAEGTRGSTLIGRLVW